MSFLEKIGMAYVVFTTVAILGAGFWFVVNQFQLDAKTAKTFWDFLKHRKAFEEWHEKRDKEVVKVTSGDAFSAMTEKMNNLHAKIARQDKVIIEQGTTIIDTKTALLDILHMIDKGEPVEVVKKRIIKTLPRRDKE